MGGGKGSNVSSENREGAVKRSKMDDKVVVTVSLILFQGLPRNITSPPSLGVREYVHTYISHINKISLAALSHRTHTLVETNNIQIKANNVKLKYNSLTLQSFPGV